MERVEVETNTRAKPDKELVIAVTLVTRVVCGGRAVSNCRKPVLGWKVWVLGISEGKRHMSSLRMLILYYEI